MTMRLLLPLSLLTMLPFAVRAGEFAVVPGTVFQYEDVPGLCPVEPERSAAEGLFFQIAASAIGPSSQSLLVLMDCPFLEALRNEESGVEVQQLQGYAAILDDGAVKQVEQSRAQFVAKTAPIFRDVWERVAAGDPAIEQALEEQRGGEVSLDEVQTLGFYDDDPSAFFGAMVANDATTPSLTVFGATLVQGYPIFAFALRPTDGAEMLEPTLAAARALIQQLIDLNDPAGAAPPGSSGWLGIDWLKVLTYAVPAVFVAWYFAVRQRRQRQEKGGGSGGTP